MPNFKKHEPPVEQKLWQKWVKKYAQVEDNVAKKNPELATTMSGVQHSKLKRLDKKIQKTLGFSGSKASVVVGIDRSGNQTTTGFVALDKVNPKAAKPLLRVFQVK